MRNVKVLSKINIINIIFIITMGILLFINLINNSIINKISTFFDAGRQYIEAAAELLNQNEFIDQIFSIIDSVEFISIIVVLFPIIINTIGLLIISFILQRLYKKLRYQEKRTYGRLLMALLLVFLAIGILIGQLDFNRFNIFAKNNVFHIMQVLIALGLFGTQFIFICLELKDTYYLRGIKTINIDIYKIIKIIVITIAICVGLNMLFYIILYIMSSTLINSINYSEVFQIKEIINTFILWVTDLFNIENKDLMDRLELTTKTTGTIAFNNFVTQNLSSFNFSIILSKVMPSLITLVVALVIQVINFRIKDHVRYNGLDIIFIGLAAILGIFMIGFANFILSTILGIIILITAIIKVITMVKNGLGGIDVSDFT